MNEHPNAVLTRRALEAAQGGDPTAGLDLLADDVIWHEIGLAEPRVGKEAVLAAAASADYSVDFTVHDVMATDVHVVTLLESRARRGDRTLEYRVAEIYDIRDGKVAERWAFSDDTERIAAFFR